MKIQWILFFLILLSISVTAQKITHTLQKEIFNAGTTLQAVIEINDTLVKEISAKNLELYQGKEKIGFAPFLQKRSDTLYDLFFETPKAVEGSFVLKLTELLFSINNSLVPATYEVPFTLKKAPAAIAFYPGIFIIKEEQMITIKAKNNGKTTELSIKTSDNIHNLYTIPQNIQKDTERTFKFEIMNATMNEDKIQFMYEDQEFGIPIIFKHTEAQKEQEEIEKTEAGLSVDLTKISKKLKEGQAVKGSINVENKDDINKEITVEITGEIKPLIDIKFPEMIGAKKSINLELEINKEKKAKPGVYDGECIIKASKQEIHIPLTVEITEILATSSEIHEVEEEKQEENKPPENKIFNFTVVPAQPPQEEKPNVAIIVLLFLFLITGIGYYLSHKKSTKKVSFNEYIRELERRKK